VSASDGLIAVAAPVVVDEAAVELEVPVAELVPVLVPDAAISPEVPLEMVVPARLTVASFARAWKFARERDALAFVFSLMTMVIPFWQCLPWEQ